MIEKLAPGNGQRLKQIRIKALGSDPDAFGTTLEQVKKFEDDVWVEQSISLPTFIAVKDERDVGMVRLGHDHDDSDTAWLISMWVSSEARSSGLGLKLVEALINECKKLGKSKVKLDVGELNPAAIRLYEKAGFKRNGETGQLPEPRSHIKEFQMEISLGL